MAKRKKADEGPKLKQYEAMFLLPAGASAELDNSLNTVRGIIERHGGEVMVLKKWDERKLSYEIKRNKRGLYIIAYFKGPGAIVSAIERDVNLSEDILRVLVTDASHLSKDEMDKVEPQPIIKEERPSWERGGFGGFDDGGGRDRGPRDRGPRREPATAGEPASAGGKD
jgi:ribosomal protein S6